MIRQLMAACLALHITNVSNADTPAEPRPIVVAADYGPFYITMFYSHDDGGEGVAYKLMEDGSSEEIWRVDFYSFEPYISNDGKYLVEMGPWAFGDKPSEEDLAVAFYKKGKLLKKYSTLDLVEDSSKVEPTASHYFWRSEDRDFPKLTYRNIFYLKTIDRILYRFDVTSGEIIEQKSPFHKKGDK